MQSRIVHDRPVKFAIAALSLAMTWFLVLDIVKASYLRALNLLCVGTINAYYVFALF
jgi:hypothetical protein